MSKKTNGFKPALSLIIPCFNEVDNVLSVVDRLAELYAGLAYQTEVIFVDGGSRDGTLDALRKRIAERGLEHVGVQIMTEKRGYGYDIMHGLRQAKGQTLAWTHADMQTDIQDVFFGYDKFLEQQSPNVIISGQRKNRKLVDAFLTFGMQVTTLLLLRVHLKDINAQPKIFSRNFFETCINGKAPDDFSLDLYLLYQARVNKYSIIRIPVFFKDRLHGEAKGGGGSIKNRLKLIRRTYQYIWSLRKNHTHTTNI